MRASRYDGHQRRITGAIKKYASSIFISAGEASGEHYGALLVTELKRSWPRQGNRPRSSAWAVNGWKRQA